MNSLSLDRITELLNEPVRATTKDSPWVCPKCKKWTTSQAGAKFHKCEVR